MCYKINLNNGTVPGRRDSKTVIIWRSWPAFCVAQIKTGIFQLARMIFVLGKGKSAEIVAIVGERGSVKIVRRNIHQFERISIKIVNLD